MMHTILFTGHMIDAADREKPRFPASKEIAVKEEILKQLLIEKEKWKDELKGIAGGASGGDILFHELCMELRIPTELYLALPAAAFKKKSVSFAGHDWDDRFDKLAESLPVHVLPEPGDGEIEQSVWERANLWMMEKTLENGGANMILLALWDGKGGDGAGGTEHMVTIAKEQGAEVNVIDITMV